MTTKKPAGPKPKRTGADIKPAKNYGNTTYGKSSGKISAPKPTANAGGKTIRRASTKGR